MATEGLIAKGLKRFRKDFKLSQKEVAGLLGITSQAYQNYEYGKGSPTAASVLKLADTYNVSADYLLGLSDTPNPTKVDEKALKATQAFQEAAKKFVVEMGLANDYLQNNQPA